MSEPQYKRVLLKLSGEALAGEASRGLDFDVIGSVCDVIKKCVACGVQIGIVVGGGNFWRGVKDGGDRMERTRADHMGMLATTINALAVADVLEQKGVDVRVQTAIEMRAMAEPYIRSKAIRHMEKGRVVIFGCGTGNPFFSTDTAAVLRAAEIDADAILLAKNIDGVYSADPKKDPSAVKYDTITYDDVLAQHLQVMDSTATKEVNKEFDAKMQKTIDVVMSDFASVRAGRANAAVLDKITVDYYGAPTPLNQVAAISSPDPRSLMIQPWDSTLLKAIEKAIQTSDLGINPQNDGKVIRLAFPQLTEERRKELTKQVKKYGENGKVAIRNIRRDAMEKFKSMEKKSEITEDDRKDYEKELQDMTEKRCKQIDELTAKKEAELMAV